MKGDRMTRTTRYGFRIVTREAFFSDAVRIEPYKGSPNLTAARIAALHAQETADLKTRARGNPGGAYVLFDPDDDAEGFLLQGDDADALERESDQIYDVSGGER
jgi:hypothetical protein